MRIPFLAATAALVLLGSAAPSMAQQDLSSGIQDLVKQMMASMEQQQKRKLAILDFTRLDKTTDNFGRHLAESLITSMFLTKRFDVIERNSEVRKERGDTHAALRSRGAVAHGPR